MWSLWPSVLLAIVVILKDYAAPTYRKCIPVQTVPYDVSKLNGTWYVYAYTLPDRELDTMCDVYHINVNSSGVYVNFTYADRLTGQQKSYLATITPSYQNGTFLYSIQNEAPNDATLVYVIMLDDCSFVNYGCQTNYDHYGSLVVATKTRNVFEVNVEQLIDKASAAGAPKDNLQIVNQKNCVI